MLLTNFDWSGHVDILLLTLFINMSDGKQKFVDDNFGNICFRQSFFIIYYILYDLYMYNLNFYRILRYENNDKNILNKLYIL